MSVSHNTLLVLHLLHCVLDMAHTLLVLVDTLSVSHNTLLVLHLLHCVLDIAHTLLVLVDTLSVSHNTLLVLHLLRHKPSVLSDTRLALPHPDTRLVLHLLPRVLGYILLPCVLVHMSMHHALVDIAYHPSYTLLDEVDTLLDFLGIPLALFLVHRLLALSDTRLA